MLRKAIKLYDEHKEELFLFFDNEWMTWKQREVKKYEYRRTYEFRYLFVYSFLEYRKKDIKIKHVDDIGWKKNVEHKYIEIIINNNAQSDIFTLKEELYRQGLNISKKLLYQILEEVLEYNKDKEVM